MRIDAYNAVSQIYGSSNKYKSEATGQSQQSDKLEISQTGKDYQTAKQAVNSTSDVREDLVSDLKSQIEDGTYEVSGESFADKLLQAYDDIN